MNLAYTDAMLLVTHSLAGATLATKIKNPFLSLPLILITHFLMDLIPHWDLGINFEKRTKGQNFFLALLDGLTSLLLVFFFFQYQKPFSFLPWAGMTVSLLPDFLEAPYLFWDLQLSPAINRLHSQVFHHANKNFFWGILPQVVIVLLCLLLIAI